MCNNCGFCVPDEPASNFKGENGFTCPNCNIVWQTKEEYTTEKKRFGKLFRKYSPVYRVYTDGKFVEISFDPEMMDKVNEEFTEESK